MDVPIIRAARLQLGALVLTAPEAGIVWRQDGEGDGGGLLPTSSFAAIYFDNAGGVAIIPFATTTAGANRRPPD
jgi:hypothetical protein